MADREKVIKGLECCRRGFCFSCPYNDGVDENVECKQRWADDALSLLKAQENGWISVKDRLPNSNRFVLVCNDDGHMMIAQYIEETAQWQYKYINYDVDVWDDEEQGPVCYWAYLPEPPKEG